VAEREGRHVPPNGPWLLTGEITNELEVTPRENTVDIIYLTSIFTQFGGRLQITVTAANSRITITTKLQ